MKKLLILTLALVLSLSLAACGSNNSGGLGDITVGGSSESPSSSGGGSSISKPSQSTQPSAKIDNPIVGKWTSSSYWAWVDGNPDNYPGSKTWLDNKPDDASNSSYLSCWEFKENGTYWNFSYIPGMYGLEGPSWVKGNYEIEGETINCTNRTETKRYDDDPNKNYIDKSLSDVTYTIRFDGDGDLIMSSNRYHNLK